MDIHHDESAGPQLSHFVKRAAIAIALFDAEMRYIAASDRWKSDFKIATDPEGGTHYEVVPNTPEHWRELHRRGQAGETLRVDPEKITRDDGSIQWVEWAIQPWRRANGDVGGVFVFSQDVTKLLRDQESLRDGEERLRAVIDTAMDGIVVIDEQRLIQSINPAALNLFGYDLGEVTGRNVKMLMPSHFRDHHDSYVADYLRTGVKKIIGIGRVVAGQRKNGASFPIELAVGEAFLTGKRVFVGFIRDLTPIDRESRRAAALQSELIHVSRLGEMGQMASNLAHEVNQPLAAIMNFTQAAGQGLRKGDMASLAGLIGRIEAQAARASDIVKRLRAFIDKREIERRPEDLRTIAEEAIGLALLDRGARNPRTILSLSPEHPIALVDRVQIQQVIVNFLRNANDAMAKTPDPEIVVELAITENGMARFAVADNGPGVDPQVADALFTPFITTKDEGMGIGLSICKTIIEGHGGQIGFLTNARGGATFYFTLPLVSADAAPEASP